MFLALCVSLPLVKSGGQGWPADYQGVVSCVPSALRDQMTRAQVSWKILHEGLCPPPLCGYKLERPQVWVTCVPKPKSIQLVQWPKINTSVEAEKAEAKKKAAHVLLRGVLGVGITQGNPFLPQGNELVKGLS